MGLGTKNGVFMVFRMWFWKNAIVKLYRDVEIAALQIPKVQNPIIRLIDPD